MPDSPGGDGVRIRLLGPVTLLAGGSSVPLATRGARSVLALLALNANHVVPCERIIDLLWSGAPPASARTVLHGHIRAVRQALARAGAAALGGDARPGQPAPCSPLRVETVQPGYRLVAAEAHIDVQVVRALHRRSAGAQPEQRDALLRRALSFWCGPALSGVGNGPGAAELDELQHEVRVCAVGAALEVGRAGEVVAEAGALAEAHPLSERCAGLLVRCLAGAGRPGEALRAYHRFATSLVRELGIEPGAELRALHAELLRGGAPASGGPASGAGDGGAGDGGAGPGSTRDPRTHGPGSGVAGTGSGPASSAPVPPWQLPPAPPELAGREAELGWLDEVLAQARRASGVAGVVCGIAGVGKTALVLSWAHRVARASFDAVLHADLRGFSPGEAPREPAEVLTAFLQSLGLAGADIPHGTEQRAGLYRSLLASQRVLVILDDARTGEQVSPLLPPGPGSLALVTSRHRLEDLVARRAAQMHVLGTLDHADAVALLAGPGPQQPDLAESADELARLCGHLPLALRIAAARLGGRPAGAARSLVAALSDQHTALAALQPLAAGAQEPGLRAALDASVAELDVADAEVLTTLGGFPGRAMRPALLAGLGHGAGVEAARARLHALAGRHLITESGPGAFTAHELVRAYLAERARAAEAEHEVLTRALRHYLAVADAARRALGPVADGLEWCATSPATREVRTFNAALDWFAEEWPNMLAVLARAGEQGRDEDVWRLVRLMHAYRVNRPLWDDWSELLDTGMAAARGLGDRRAVFWMLISRAAARLVFDRTDGLLAATEEALAVAAELAEPALRVTAATHYGCALTVLGRHDEAIAAHRRALDEAERIGDPAVRGQAAHNYAEELKRAGRYTEAMDLQWQACGIYTELGHHGDLIRGMVNVADMSFHAGALDEAERVARATITRAVEREFRLQEAVARRVLGRVLAARGAVAAARDELTASLELHADVGDHNVGELRAELAELAGR